MAAPKSTSDGRPVSRQVFQLARLAGFSEQQAQHLGSVATTLEALRRADPERIARAIEADGKAAGRLVEAARLAGLKGLAPRAALAAVDDGITAAAIAGGGEASALMSAAGVTERELAQWRLQLRVEAGRGERRQPAAASTTPPRRSSANVRKFVLDSDADWAQLAKDRYSATGSAVATIASRLAIANGSTPDAAIARGTAVLLPDVKGRTRRLPAAQSSVAAWRKFAPYLSKQDAAALVDAGFTTPAALRGARRLETYGLDSSRWQQVRLQAELAGLSGLDPAVAHYLAVDRPRSLTSLLGADVTSLAAELSQAQGLGLLDGAVDVGAAAVTTWLAELLIVVVDLGWVIVWNEDPAVCDTTLPESVHLENYYTYRFIPAGRSASDLQREIDQKAQWLTEVQAYRAGASSSARASEFGERGLGLTGLGLADFEYWLGSGSWDLSSDETLGKLAVFVASNVRVLELVHALVEGHEAYRHREYGAALMAYERVDQWFAANKSADLQNQQWWENGQAANGTPRPAFLISYEASPGYVLLAQLVSYYETRHTAADRDSLLKTLHVTADDYRRWPLFPLRLDDLGAHPDRELSFAKFLYYLSKFGLPMLKADCYRCLGQYCPALEHYFRAHYESSFTGPLASAREQEITAAKGGGNSAATLNRFALPPAPQRYYTEFLNDVEKRAVRLKVAETLLEWADLHFRRRETSEAETRYAQVLRVLNDEWRAVSGATASTLDAAIDAAGLNPRAVAVAFAAHAGLAKIGRGLNHLGYSDDYVPIWTYGFLLGSARYFAERARQMGRDALQFLAAAEQEQASQRMLLQTVSLSEAQLAIESRRVDDAVAAVAIAKAGIDLASLRVANSADRRAEFEQLAPIRMALGVVGGAVGGAGSAGGVGGAAGGLAGGVGGAAGSAIAMPFGAAGGALSGYLSTSIELQAQRNELIRMQAELESASGLASAELARARIGVELAALMQGSAIASAKFAASNLDFARAKTLNAEFWYDMATRLSDMAATQLERAVGVGFLCEQAFEFREGRKLDVIRFDYGQTEGQLAADALLSDLDTIEYERITAARVKSAPIKYAVRLRDRDFLAFTEFKQTGNVTFDVSLFSLDLAHPGTYQQRISAVEVEVRGLLPPTGVRGTLRKSGLSYLRYPHRRGAAAPPNTRPDWISHTPVDFRVAPVIQAPETLVLSAFDQRRDGFLLRPDAGEQLRAFEGSGVATTWTLTIDPALNEFDLSTLTDVDVTIYFDAKFDEDLERAIKLERRKLIAMSELPLHRSRGFSLREAFPDALYHLHHPPTDAATDPWQRRELTLDIPAGVFPPNQIGRRLKGITLVFVGRERFVDVRASLVNGAASYASAAFQPAPDNPAVRAVDGNDNPPEGRWQLAVTAADNVTLALAGRYRVDAAGRVVLDATRKPIADPAGVPAFDPALMAGIEDVWVIFNYTYSQAGETGEPVPMWADFADADRVRVARPATAGQPAGSTLANWQSETRSGPTAWAVQNGVLQQTGTGSGFYRPDVAATRRDARLAASVSLPPAASVAVGVAFRWTPAGGANPASGYVARLTRQAAAVEVAIDQYKPDGSVTTIGTAALSAPAGLLDFDLDCHALKDRAELRVNGRAVLSKPIDATLTGGVGLFAAGAGGAFRTLVVSDLSGR